MNNFKAFAKVNENNADSASFISLKHKQRLLVQPGGGEAHRDSGEAHRDSGGLSLCCGRKESGITLI